MRRHQTLALALVFVAAGAACAPDTSELEGTNQMDTIAESYVRLVLAVGEHDADYVDAFYGPAEWREQVTEQGRR